MMSAASVGEVTARAQVPREPELDDVPTRFAIALNVLLDDLSTRVTSVERMAERLRVLAEASHEFSAATQDLERLLASIARRLTASVGDLCIVLLASPDDRELVPVALDAQDDDTRRRLRELYVDPMPLALRPIAQRVHVSGEPFLWPKVDLEQLRSQTTPGYFEFVERRALGPMARDRDLTERSALHPERSNQQAVHARGLDELEVSRRRLRSELF